MVAFTPQIIGLGTVPGDKTGNSARGGGTKINANFAVLFNAFTIDSTTFAITFNGESVSAIKGVDGTNLAPAYGFLNDLDTGMYRISGGRLGFTVNGVKASQIDATLGSLFEKQLIVGSGATSVILGPTGTFTAVKDSNSTRTGFVMQNPTGNVGTIGANSANFRIDAPLGKLQLFTSGAQALEFAQVSQAAVFFDGVAFSGDTAIAANLLDDFEKGIFTCTLQDTSASDAEGQTYSIQSGHFTKLGDILHFVLNIKMSSLGALSGDARLGGMPFQPFGAINQAIYCSFAAGLNIVAGQNIGGRTSASTPHVLLTIWDLATGTSNLTVAEVSANGEMLVSGSYKV